MAGMMQAPQEDTSWRAPNFRQNMVSKIEEAIINCGAPTNKNAAEMENQVYQKASTKSEYLSFVARLILHIKEMGKPKLPGQMGGMIMGSSMAGMGGKGQMGPGGMQQQQTSQIVQSLGQPTGPMGVQIAIGQGPPISMSSMNIAPSSQGGNVGNNIPQTMGSMGMNQQQPQQSGGGIMGQQVAGLLNQSGGMMGQSNTGGGMISQQVGMVGQQTGGGIVNQQGQLIGQPSVRIMAPTPQVSMGGVMGQQGQGVGMMTQSTIGQMGISQSMSSGVNVNATMAQQGQQNNPQIQMNQQSQSQMINQNFMAQQQMQQQTPMSGQSPIPVAPGSINSPQMQQQLQQQQMQQALLQQQQHADQQQGPRGPGRIRMGGGMAGLQQQMPRKGLHRPITPMAVGSPRGDYGTNYPMNKLIYFGSQQVDGTVAHLPSQFSGQPGSQPGMQRPFMSPSGSPVIGSMAGSASASPTPMSIQGGTQPGFAPSSQPIHPHGSPAPAPPPPGPRPLGNQMVPSPSTVNLNTPMQMAATPSPRNPEELFKVNTRNRNVKKFPAEITASIGDPKLPKVPTLKILIPCAYPEECPILIDFKKDYGTTPFLISIAQAFKSRKALLALKRFTLYELLLAWEISVRQVANPSAKRKPSNRLITPLIKKKGRLGLPFL